MLFLKSSDDHLIASTFRKPNKVLLLSHRKAPHDMVATTTITEATPSFFAYAFGWYHAYIST